MQPKGLRSYLHSYSLIIATIFALPNLANAGGKGTATAGKVMGGVLVGVGVYTVYRGYTQYTTNTNAQGIPCAIPLEGASPCKTKALIKIGMGLLETAGGAAALMSNSETESQLDAGNQSPEAELPGMEGYTGGGNPNLPDLCASMPEACKVDPSTNRPTLALPPKTEMMAALTKSFGGRPTDPSGLTLEQALQDLDEKYDAASNAVDAFNTASNSGAFDSAMNGDSELASTGQGDGDSGDGTGLNTARGVAGGVGAAGSDLLTLPTGETTDWTSLLNKTKAERGPQKAGKATGLNIEDAGSGRVLSLWERVSRAIRGTRDRDILLAKVEWTRQNALKKQGIKKPHVAVSTEKN